MAPQDELLRSICHSTETLNSAQAILRLAQQRTGPGSGFELGPYKTGLPAICAYIASTRLNNTDVTRNNAQTASCLKTSDFNKALDTVQAAIGGSRRTRSGRDVHEALIQQYASTFDHRQFSDWMGAVDRALIQSDDRFDANSGGVDLKCAVFYWTLNVATGKPPAAQPDFAAEHCISAKLLTKFLTKINGCCNSVKARIQNDLKVQRSPAKVSVATTPRRTPKRPARTLPTRDSPTKRKAEELTAQLESDDEMGGPVPETPSKKRRAESPSLPPLPSPTKLAFPPVASSSRVALGDQPRAPPGAPPRPDTVDDDDAMSVDEDAYAFSSRVRFDDGGKAEERSIRRRFRPIYLDHKQWYAVDKRVKRLWKQAERYKASIKEHHGHLLNIQA
ncbi:hypothetical protein DXG01_008044 [Tephrocybe rancida]|nr:hypothetical protein DXG01_008044 [Tephrocybe rancida]